MASLWALLFENALKVIKQLCGQLKVWYEKITACDGFSKG